MSKPLAKRMKLLLSASEDADIYFLVGDGDGKELLQAHKLILKHASDVFEAMFRFDAKKEKAEFASANCPVVEVPDVEASAFKVMLSFIYTEDLSELDGDNAMAVLYAAKKYDIYDLVDRSLQIPISKLCNALRWADAKCRQNGIECSAENRRAMLGPALLKIRFPLLSNEEFSKKIVPSGVLSKDEVIGVYQFNSLLNCREISDGIMFPMPFPTNGRVSDRKKGTLLMDIEKVSEFAREEVESSRYSEKVFINGLPWKIWAQIKTKTESTDNEKCLCFFLLCDSPKKKLMDPSNGFYDKSKDKVTLDIDVTTTDEPKMDKFILDQSKSKGTLFTVPGDFVSEN
ncbi:hypothetical protein niasHT_038865 [Heterodera trifolii]|uniref:BTB domain-containing protein n=1 Tax=Heterodera trifolii TaxID=157864 RepID=A0ABD2ILW1_9BILA